MVTHATVFQRCSRKKILGQLFINAVVEEMSPAGVVQSFIMYIFSIV